MNKSFWSIFLLLLITILLLVPNAAFAHTSLEKTYPLNGGKIEVSPLTIEAWFQDPIITHPKSMKMVDQTGTEVLFESILVDPKNNKHINGKLKDKLASGSYTVKLNVLALDGDVITEEFNFELLQTKKVEEKIPLKLIKQKPTDGETTTDSPEQIDLWFNQDVVVTAIGLFNDQQKSIPIGEPMVEPDDPSHVTIEVNERLKKGTYQVTWYAKQSVQTTPQPESLDVFYFAVDEYSPIKTGTGDVKDREFWFKSMGLKQISYLFIFIGTMILFGGTLLNQINSNHHSVRWKKATFILAAILLLGEILLIRSQLSEILNLPVLQLLTIKFIWLPIVQTIVIFVGLVSKKYKIFFYGVAILMMPFYIGHASYPRYGGEITLLMNGLHLLSASVWIGGVFALLVPPTNHQEEWIKKTALSFSKWALGSLLIIIITGVSMTIQYVPTLTFSNFWSSEWGKSILLKTIFTFIIVLTGYIQRKNIKKFISLRIKPFVNLLRIEVIYGLLILVFASILVVSVPNAEGDGLTLIEKSDYSLPIKAELYPLKAGVNELSVTFDNEKVKDVNVIIEMPPNYKATYHAFKVKPNIFKITGNLLHAPGTSYLEVRAFMKNGKELEYRYKVEVPGEMNE
jgi:copper transport protein